MHLSFTLILFLSFIQLAFSEPPKPNPSTHDSLHLNWIDSSVSHKKIFIIMPMGLGLKKILFQMIMPPGTHFP